MSVAIVGAVTALLGVLLGGGVRAWEANRARKLEAASLLSALVCEIEAITRLINHRQFVGALTEVQQHAQAMIANGRGSEPANFLQLKLSQDYLAVFKASVEKLGLLTPYQSDRIVRFYTYVKAVQENYEPGSPFQLGVSASAANEIVTNDLMLLHTVVVLGNHIAGFRTIAAPQGMVDPFGGSDQPPAQPAMPTPAIADASIPAGST